MPDPKLPSSPRSDREPPSTATRIAAIGVVGVAAVIVVGMFVWMVPPAAAREAKAACGGLRPTMTNPALGQLPTVAPDFTVTGHDGKQVKLSDFRGKVVLLNFWASWCGVCKSEKPSLEEMTRHMAGDQFAVVTLASDKEWKPVQEALPNGSPFQVFLDPPDRVGHQGGARELHRRPHRPHPPLLRQQARLGLRRRRDLPAVAHRRVTGRTRWRASWSSTTSSIWCGSWSSSWRPAATG
jgi:thiol-disulfide isomerase/thioredoxin